METVTIRGQKFNVEKRSEGQEGKSNTIVYLTRPRGSIAHITTEYKRNDGSIFYGTVTALHHFKIK